MIRDATANDLRGVVEVHQDAFPGFLMTQLGPGFLLHYYNTILDYDRKVFVVVEDANKVVGFAAGFMDPRSFYALYSRRKRGAMMAAASRVALRPSVWVKVVANVFEVRSRASTNEGAATDVELASIAVSPSASGSGYGKALVKEFFDRARIIGGRTVVLTTDADGNDAVNKFYRKLGFVLAARTTRTGGRSMNHYRYSL